jgi:hypothetical protein
MAIIARSLGDEAISIRLGPLLHEIAAPPVGGSQ